MSFYAKLRDKTTSYTTPLVHLAAWNPIHSRWDRFEYPGLQLRIEDSSLAIEVVASIDVPPQKLRPNQPSIVSNVVATQLWLPRDPKQPIGYYLHDSGFVGQQQTESEGPYVVYYARLDDAGSVFTVSEGLKGSPCQMAGEKFRILHDGLERMASHKILGRAQELWIKLGVAQSNVALAGDIFRQFGGFGLLHKNLLPSGPDSPFVGIFERGSDNVPFERYHDLPQVSPSIARPTSITDGSPASLKSRSSGISCNVYLIEDENDKGPFPPGNNMELVFTADSESFALSIVGQDREPGSGIISFATLEWNIKSNQNRQMLYRPHAYQATMALFVSPNGPATFTKLSPLGRTHFQAVKTRAAEPILKKIKEACIRTNGRFWMYITAMESESVENWVNAMTIFQKNPKTFIWARDNLFPVRLIKLLEVAMHNADDQGGGNEPEQNYPSQPAHRQLKHKKSQSMFTTNHGAFDPNKTAPHKWIGNTLPIPSNEPPKQSLNQLEHGSLIQGGLQARLPSRPPAVTYGRSGLFQEADKPQMTGVYEVESTEDPEDFIDPPTHLGRNRCLSDAQPLKPLRNVPRQDNHDASINLLLANVSRRVYARGRAGRAFGRNPAYGRGRGILDSLNDL